MSRGRWMAVAMAVCTLLVGTTPASAGRHTAEQGGGGPVGRHDPGEKDGSEGNVGAKARSLVIWADNFSSVTLEDGFGEAGYCAPGACAAEGRSDVPADRLALETKFVVWGKEVSVTNSGSASWSGGKPNITVGKSETTGEKTITVTWVYDAGRRAETNQTVTGIRVDGKKISRADHVVVGTAERNGQVGHAEARTTTYLR